MEFSLKQYLVIVQLNAKVTLQGQERDLVIFLYVERIAHKKFNKILLKLYLGSCTIKSKSAKLDPKTKSYSKTSFNKFSLKPYLVLVE